MGTLTGFGSLSAIPEEKISDKITRRVLAGQKGLLALMVGVWAYYHVIRQHYGFLVLYKVKNRDLLPLDNRLDRLFLFDDFLLQCHDFGLVALDFRHDLLLHLQRRQGDLDAPQNWNVQTASLGISGQRTNVGIHRAQCPKDEF